jgi:3'-phosphoadenosine 5'-phosphosulfate sulfotransferase (PAPS reductase)/FAD synthetase
MEVISASYGNDSIALIQWMYEAGYKGCYVVYIDTGWASVDWPERVKQGEALAKSYGFTTCRIGAVNKFADLMRVKKGFPSQRYQWCSAHLKGIPFLDWLCTNDVDRDALVIIGKRKYESKNRADTKEWVCASEYHDHRDVWHPLHEHTDAMRDELVVRAGFEVLPNRSQECAPCINANRSDFLILSDDDIAKVEMLEASVGKTMFRPYRHMGAVGVRAVVEWARSGRGKYNSDQVSMCHHGMCGH